MKRRDASIFRFAQCQVCFANIAPALRCNIIITQIGRESKISTEICILRVAEDVAPYKHCVKHPYDKERKGFFFLLFHLKKGSPEGEPKFFNSI